MDIVTEIETDSSPTNGGYPTEDEIAALQLADEIAELYHSGMIALDYNERGEMIIERPAPNLQLNKFEQAYIKTALSTKGCVLKKQSPYARNRLIQRGLIVVQFHAGRYIDVTLTPEGRTAYAVSGAQS